MHSIVDHEYWQIGKPVSRLTTSRVEIVWIALVAIAVVVFLGTAYYRAIAAVVILGAAYYGFPLQGSPSEMFLVAP